MRKPDQAELELSDFIKRTEEGLDTARKLQFAAALAYIKGRSEPVSYNPTRVQAFHKLIAQRAAQ